MDDPNRINSHILHQSDGNRGANFAGADPFSLKQGVPQLNGGGGQEITARDLSQRILIAVYQNVSSGFDENNLPYTRCSFRVTDSTHGIVNQKVVVIKQCGLAELNQLDNGVTQLSRIAGMPRYVPG